MEDDLSETEKDIEEALIILFLFLSSDVVIRTIKRYLEAGDIESIVTYVNDQVKSIQPVLNQSFINIGNKQAKILQQKLQRYTGGKEIFVFNPVSPRAAEISRNISMMLIRDITENQRKIIYDTINRLLLDSANSLKIARELSKVIGLTESQEQSVKNYRNLLEKGSKEALTRELRDKRFDSSVGKPLNQDQIDKMVDAYRRKYIRYRAKVIATTEAGRIVSEAQEEALRQIVEEFGIPDDDVVRTWHTTMDGRQRDTHGALNGRKSSLNGHFTTFMGNRLRYPRDPQAPASEVCNCRCRLTINFNKDN